MKRMNKWMIAAIVMIAFTTGTNAQTLETAPTYSGGGSNDSKVKVNLLYNYSLPTGSFKNDFIGNNSPRGFNADVLYWFQPKWGVGAAFGFQDYYQKNARQTYKLSDGSDISAVQTNSLQVIPIMAKVMFSPGAEGTSAIQPYVSLAAGVNLVHFNEYLGEFTSLDNSSAKFGATAGAGIKVPFGSRQRVAFLLGADYRYTPYKKYQVDNLNSVNLQAGLQFKLSK